jgi:tetratricopeptide (TPR) repeat protein
VLHNSLNEFEKAEGFANQSIKILDRLAAEHPDVFEYRNQQAYSYYILGSVLTHVKREGVAESAFQRSASLYEALISERPDAIGCYSELMLCYNPLIKLQIDRGATQDAKQTVERLVALRTKLPPVAESSPVLCTIADSLENHGRVDEAISAYRKAIEIQPDNALAYNRLAYLLSYWKGEWEEAEKARYKEIEIAPSAESYLNLGLTLGPQGKHAEAVAAFRKSLELDSKNDVAHYSLGLDLSFTGQLDEAVSASRKAVEMSPENPMYLNHLAWMLATVVEPKDRDPQQAVELAKKAVKVAPQVANFWDSLGVAEYRAGNWQPAIDALEKATQLTDGGDACAWFFLAMAHHQLGDLDEAQQSFNKGVEWIDKNASQIEHLRRSRAAEVESLFGFRAEAAELLGVTQPQRPTDSSNQAESPKPKGL